MNTTATTAAKPLHTYHVRCAGIEVFIDAANTADALFAAMELYGAMGASAKRVGA